MSSNASTVNAARQAGAAPSTPSTTTHSNQSVTTPPPSYYPPMDPYDPDDDAEDPVVIKINTPTQIFGHNNVVVTPQTDALSALVAAAGSHNRTAPNPVRVSLQLNRDVNVQGDGNFVGGVASAMAKLGIPQPGQPGAAAGRAAVISGASRAPGPSAGAPGGGAPGELPGDGDKKRKAHEESENLPDRKRINSPGPVAKASSRH